MLGRVETVNKAIFVIELNPLQSVVKSGHQALQSACHMVLLRTAFDCILLVLSYVRRKI